MALDNANFIAELSITDPPGSDPLSQGDDQIRTIKRATFQSFPLIAAAVNLTDVQMNLMAIKNEANVFTADQTITGDVVILPSANNVQTHFSMQKEGGLDAWKIARQASTVTSDLVFQRFDGLGAFVEVVARVQFTNGVWDFTHVPTVLGAPLWVAGEIRMFTQAAVPGTNWFLADGTNGTANLTDRALLQRGASSTGTALAPNLVATAAAGTTGATALTESQLPAHNHTVWMTNNAAGGITDQNLNTGDNVFGGRRNDSSKQFAKSNGTRDVIGNAGSGSTHTHSSPAQAVTENGADRQTVRPLSFVVEMYQYVP